MSNTITKYLLILSLILSLYTVTAEDTEELDKCEVDSKKKVDCGKVGTTQTECENKGCCWKEDNTPGIPWCFHPINTDSSCSIIEDKDKVDCGYNGITLDKCEKQGCCWQPSDVKGVPWCYFKLDDQCRVTENKLDCGYNGINQQECEDIGCCWVPNSKNQPWCYNTLDYEKVRGCKMALHERVDCGHSKITQKECEAKGCCWSPSPIKDQGIPWCFYVIGDATEDEPEKPITDPECIIDEDDRERCNDKSLDEEGCLKYGCCWHETEYGGVPFCYKRKKGENTIDKETDQ